MGKWKHKLSNLDEEKRTANCAHCGNVRISKSYTSTSKWRCIYAKKPELAYRKNKSNVCAECNFKGHPCQLDVDHIDGNHKNNLISNLQTLCANCHRLKTFMQKNEFYAYSKE
jgi:5-methylcytosine-specific restriction endonuclease McrA